jgi:antitoxin ParD1/3/4
MPTRNVVLTTHHESVIETLVQSGRYQNASEVLREGLRLVEEREAREAAKLEALKDAARVGFSDLDQGRYRDFQDDELEGLVARLGQRAADRIRSAGR